jgi:hypothetical protein
MNAMILPDMYVLDTLANDVEDMESILRMLNSDTNLGWRREWGRDFTKEDVVAALSRLIHQDFVQVFALDGEGKMIQEIGRRIMPAGTYADAYFGITQRGRLVHSNWDDPESPGTP